MNAEFYTVTSQEKNESNIDILLDTMLPTAYISIMLISNFILYVIFN